MKCQSCNIETKLENNNSERKPTKKRCSFDHNLDSTGHVISKLHYGQSCNIKTIYQPILAVTDLISSGLKLATGGKNCSLAKTARGSLLPQTITHKTKKKISLPCCHALLDLMPPLDKSPSSVGGRQRNSRATPIYPSTTLPAKQFARFALLSMK